MIFRIRASLAAAVAALLALSACDSATEGDVAPQGSVTFAYAGDHAGAFDATGRFDRDRPGAGTFAVGSRPPIAGGQEALLVLSHALRTGSSTLADEFLLSVENPAVGTVTCVAEQEDCPLGALFFLGANRAGGSQDVYTSVSGTVTITSISEDRARGTFSFQMEGFDDDEELQTTSVTSGTFDVPLVENVG